MQLLTPRQSEVLQFIAVFQEECGAPPTLREIAHHFKFRSPTAASDHLRALRRKGYLTHEPRLARYSRIVSRRVPRRPVVDIPVYGPNSGSFTDQKSQQAQDSISVDARGLGFQRGDGIFALHARGDSMIGCNILDGDLVILAPGRSPRSGDVVAALIDNESTLKTFVVEKGKPALRAENPLYPALIPITKLVIQGVMVALIRKCPQAAFLA